MLVMTVESNHREGYNPRMESRDQQRRRLTGALFVGNALASTSFICALTVASIAAEELSGSTQLGGIPNALGTAGAALGATLLTALSQRSGRRIAFTLGFATSAVGGAIAATSLWTLSLGALMGGMFILGFGRSVSQLSRFAAGDLWPAKRRASAIGLVVWAATIGSVVGPLLIVPASRAGTAYLGAELAGPFVLTGLGFALAAAWYFASLRPEPLTLAADSDESIPDAGEHPQPLRELLRRPTVELSFLVLMASQFVMILLMTMMPLHIRGHHSGLALVSGVMMVHTLGMYAIAPITGLLVDRLGARPLIALGALLMVLSALVGAGAGEAQPMRMSLSMFLLGVGWNFGFVAASAVLQQGLALRDALRLQGLADSATWASGGVAALASGFIVAAWSFQALACLGAGVALIPWIALWRASRHG
jgi:predicted MFS family arabinose efflux permease